MQLSSLLIVGVGGHGKVVADAVLESVARWHSISATDADEKKCIGFLIDSVPIVLAGMAKKLTNNLVHISIGNNAWREKESIDWGLSRCVTIVHPRASVSKNSEIDRGCFVAAAAVVGPSVFLSSGVIVNHSAVIDHDCVIGEYSHIAPNATLGGGVKIGNRVLIGSGSVVMPGLKITDNVVVGAGAVVTKSIYSSGVYVGIPAKKI